MSNVLRGVITNPDVIYGKSAYEIAVMHSFDGTEEEWLDSLTQETADKAEEMIADKRAEAIAAIEPLVAETEENAKSAQESAESANASAQSAAESLASLEGAFETAKNDAVAEAAVEMQARGAEVVAHIESLAEGAYNIVQTAGYSENKVMSQAASTAEIAKIGDSVGAVVRYSPNNEAAKKFVIAYHFLPGHTYLLKNTSEASGLSAGTQVIEGMDAEAITSWIGAGTEISFTPTYEAFYLYVYFTTANGSVEIVDTNGLTNRFSKVEEDVGKASRRVSGLEEELKEASSKYEWEGGTLTNGQEGGAYHRCRTKHIACNKGDIVVGSTFMFTVSEYDESKNFISVSGYVNRYEVLNDGYIRLISRNLTDTEITPADIAEISDSIFIAKRDGVYGRVSALEKAMDNEGFYQQVDQKVEELFDKVKADTDSNTLVIGVTTDNHYSPITDRGINQVGYASVYRRICEELGVDLHLNLGDIVDESEVEGNEMTVNRERIADMARVLTKTHIPFAYAIAHHEGKPHIGINSQGESEYTFPVEKTFGLLGRYCRHLNDVHMSDNKNSTSYYIDFDMQKIRLVVLDSVSNSQTGYSAKVVNFLSNEALKNIPSGYKVLVASHVPTRASANWDGYPVTNGEQIESALNAYAARGGAVLAHIHGHTHWDNIVKESGMSYPLISLCCAGIQKMDVVTYGTAKGVVGNPTSYDRSNDDFSAYCMDIFCIHGDTGEINMYRFGVGGDRTYSPN